jgi:repressor LexA
MSFGTILKKIRQDRGFTQEELAKKVDTSRSNIANYEVDKNMPSIDMLDKLSEALNVSTDTLLGKEPIKEIDLIDKLFLIPIVGRVPAGEPLLAEENIEGYLPIDPIMYNLTSPDNLFFLRVVGESMNNIVPDGSFVLVKKQNYAETGDVVVALVNGDNEATLKRFKDLDNNFVMLEPDSTLQEFTPRIINLRDTEFKIIGKVIGDFKKWN